MFWIDTSYTKQFYNKFISTVNTVHGVLVRTNLSVILIFLVHVLAMLVHQWGEHVDTQ